MKQVRDSVRNALICLVAAQTELRGPMWLASVLRPHIPPGHNGAVTWDLIPDRALTAILEQFGGNMRPLRGVVPV